jgi:hypothetical protein
MALESNLALSTAAAGPSSFRLCRCSSCMAALIHTKASSNFSGAGLKTCDVCESSKRVSYINTRNKREELQSKANAQEKCCSGLLMPIDLLGGDSPLSKWRVHLLKGLV